MSDAMQTKIEKLEQQIALLTKVADKSKIARFTPKEEMGMSIKISLYRQDLEDTPRVVKSWRMIRDDVRTTREHGIQEKQIVAIELFPTGDEPKVDTRVLKMQLANAVKAKDEKKIDEIQAKIDSIQFDPNTIEMSYEDFALNYIEKVECTVLATEQRDGDTFFEVEYEGETYKLGATFIN